MFYPFFFPNLAGNFIDLSGSDTKKHEIEGEKHI